MITEKLMTTDFKLGIGKLSISQTEQNQLRQDIVNDLKNRIGELYPKAEIYFTADGIIVEHYNDKINNAICFALNVTMKKLNYVALEEEEAYSLELQNKMQEKAKKEIAKQEKIARDKAKRKTTKK